MDNYELTIKTSYLQGMSNRCLIAIQGVSKMGVATTNSSNPRPQVNRSPKKPDSVSAIKSRKRNKPPYQPIITRYGSQKWTSKMKRINNSILTKGFWSEAHKSDPLHLRINLGLPKPHECLTPNRSSWTSLHTRWPPS